MGGGGGGGWRTALIKLFRSTSPLYTCTFHLCFIFTPPLSPFWPILSPFIDLLISLQLFFSHLLPVLFFLFLKIIFTPSSLKFLLLFDFLSFHQFTFPLELCLFLLFLPYLPKPLCAKIGVYLMLIDFYTMKILKDFFYLSRRSLPKERFYLTLLKKNSFYWKESLFCKIRQTQFTLCE